MCSAIGEPPRFEPRRELGRTGFVATALGAGDLADRSLPLESCVATLSRALDAGLNLVDTAPGYEDGYSETIVGKALAGRARDRLFVIDKIDHFERPVAEQLDASLGRLGLEYVDLVVFHGVSALGAWRKLEVDGRLDELARCVAQGKARFVGISSHHPEVLRDAVPSGRCDVVMFPIGPCVDRRYLDEILPLTRAHRVGSVCFKTFGAGKLLGDTSGYNQPLAPRPRGKFGSGGRPESSEARLPRLTVAECLGYTLTCDPDVALLGLSYPNEQDAAFEAARTFAPLAPAELARIRERAGRAIDGKGPCWWNPPSESAATA